MISFSDDSRSSSTTVSTTTTISTTTSVTTTESTTTSERTTHFDGKWYLFKDKLDHDKAIDFCNQLGGKLFEPKSETVNNKLRQMATDKGFNQYLWLGIHDISNEGHFVYQSDQSPGIFYLC